MLFLASDIYLLTTGSRDICILQWAVEGKLPAVNEEEEYDMENEVAQAGRRQKHVPSDDESYHSDGSDGVQEESNYEYSKNVARGRQARGRQQVYDNSHYSEDSLPHQAPQDHQHPSRKSRHLSHQEEDDSRAVGRSPRRNIPSQDTRSQQGSYAARFNKHKAANNTRWNSQASPQQEPEDLSHYSDEESPRQHQGHGARGGGRGRHPAKGQDRQWDRRPMR